MAFDLTLGGNDDSKNKQRSRRDERAAAGQKKPQVGSRSLARPQDRALSHARSDPTEKTARATTTDIQHAARSGTSTDPSRHRYAACPSPNVGVSQHVSEVDSKFFSPKSASATSRDTQANKKSSPTRSFQLSNVKSNDPSSRPDPTDGSGMRTGLKNAGSGTQGRNLPKADLPPTAAARINTRDNAEAPLGMKRHREAETADETLPFKKPRVEAHSQNHGSDLSSAIMGSRARRPAIVPSDDAGRVTARQNTPKEAKSTPSAPPHPSATTESSTAGRASTRNNGQPEVIILDDDYDEDASTTQDVRRTHVLTPKQQRTMKHVVVDLSNDDDGGGDAPVAQSLHSSPHQDATPKTSQPPASSADVSSRLPKTSARSSQPKMSAPHRHIGRPNEKISPDHSGGRIEAAVNPSKSSESRSKRISRNVPRLSPLALDASNQGSEEGKDASKENLIDESGHPDSNTSLASSPQMALARATGLRKRVAVSGLDSQRAAAAAPREQNARATSSAQEEAGNAVNAKEAALGSAVAKQTGTVSTLPSKSSTANGSASSNPKPPIVAKTQPTPARNYLQTVLNDDQFWEKAQLALKDAARRTEQRSTPRKAPKQRSEPLGANSTATPFRGTRVARVLFDDTRKPDESPQAPGVARESSAIASSTDKHVAEAIQARVETLAQTVERTVGAELGTYAADNKYYTRVQLKHARLSKKTDCSSGGLSRDENHDGAQASKPYSFKSWTPLKIEPRAKGTTSKITTLFDAERPGRPGKMKLAVPHIPLRPQDDMPAYAHYVSIKENFLAANNRNLHYWPYFEDEFDYEERGKSLRSQYDLDILPRRRKLALLQRAESLEAYAGVALQKLNLTWSDVLSYLLDPQPNIGEDNADALRALMERDAVCDEDFKRGDERAQTVLSCLPPPKPERIARAAVLCERFSKMARISIWQIARKHLLDSLPQDLDKGQALFLDAFTCRVCMRFDCPYHGQIDEYEDEYDELDEMSPEQRKDDPVITDIIHPRKVNYRTRTAFNPAPVWPSDAPAGPTSMKKRDLGYWQKFFREPAEQDVFHPCHHPGLSCNQAECSCYDRGLPCEKTCSCSPFCARKFVGCNCKKGGKKVCFEDERCLCSALGRECDPDLCGSCGVIDVVDPVNRYNDDICKGKCKNAGIQRGVSKRTLVGDSAIHGFGLCIGEDVGPDEFIGEYKGELITKEEAERRGAVYEFQGLSYLFALNKTQELDSTYFGNKIRFINHANAGRNNTYPRVRVVNAVHHIALYSKQKLKSGEELFFDYGPKFGCEALGGAQADQKKSKSGRKVRDSNVMLAQEYEVEHAYDDRGNLRAVKGAKRGRTRKGLVAKERRGGGANAKKDGGAVDGLDDLDWPDGIAAGAAAPQDEEMRDADVDDAGGDDRLTAYYVDGSDGVELSALTHDAGDEDDEDYDDGQEEDDDEVSSDRDVEVSPSPRVPRRSGRSAGRGGEVR